MLPDIPPLKREIAKLLQSAFQKRVNSYMGVLNDVPRYYVKEGSRIVTIRPDGRRDETTLKEASAETTVGYEEIPYLTFEERLAKLDDAAREMARQISEDAFSKIDQAVEEVGNVVSGRGKPLNPEVLLEMYEKIQLDFDEEGKHKELTIVIPPGMEQQAREAIEMLHQCPEYHKRYKEIIDRKRMEWRDRETSRRLVG